MKSVTRRKQQQEDLRTKILDAARELFVSEGVEAVSMRKVADKIGYSATTLYNYFQDKDALLFAVCDADFGTLQEMFKKIGTIINPVERMVRMGAAYTKFALDYPSHYRLLFMTPRIHRGEGNAKIERGNPDQDCYAFVRTTVAEALEGGYFRKEYHDPDLIAQVVWSAVHGVASLHLIMGKDDWVKWRNVEEVASTAVEVTIRGLLRGGRSKTGTLEV